MNSSHLVDCGHISIYAVYTMNSSTDKTSDIIACVVNVVLSLLTSIGNVSVIVAYNRNRHLQTKSNLSILTLAITDLLVGVLVQPSFVWVKLTEMHGTINCGMEIASDLSTKFCVMVSLLILGVVVSYERYLAIFRPFKHRTWLTKNKLEAVIIFVWLGALAFIALIPVGIPGYVYRAFGLALIFISLLVPVTLYAKIGKKLRGNKRKTQPELEISEVGQVMHNVFRHSAKQQIRAAVTLFYVLGALFASHIPIVCGFVYVAIYGQDLIYQKFLWTWGVTFLFFNSFCNPFIYSWRNRHMSLAIRTLFVKRNPLESSIRISVIPFSERR